MLWWRLWLGLDAMKTTLGLEAMKTILGLDAMNRVSTCWHKKKAFAEKANAYNLKVAELQNAAKNDCNF